MKRLLSFLAVTGMVLYLAGCGLYSDDKHNRTLAEDESVYQVGNPVPAVGFDESQTILLYVKGEDGSFEKVENGRYLPRSKYTFGVKVTPRTTDGKVMDQVVQLSDGGWKEGIEAAYNADHKMYIADFKISGFMTSPILIQVIYPDGQASKAKFVVKTAENLAAPYGMLVDRGLSITLSKDFLHSLPPAINPLIKEQLGNIDIRDIAPADNTSAGKKKNGVLNIDVMGLKCDVILNDTAKGTRGLSIGIEDVTGGTAGNLLELITGVFAKLFLKNLNLNNIPIMALGFPLGDLVAGMMNQPASPIAGMLPEGMELSLKLDATLFLNLLGYPEETTTNFAVLGGALYVPDNDDIVKDKDGKLLWPQVTIDPTETGIAAGMARIESIDPARPTDIGVAVSQYNLNQMMQGLMKGLEVQVKSINKTVALFSPKDKSDNLDLIVTINPSGMAIDFAAHTIVVNDVNLLLVESGKVNGPVTELSLDLTLLFDASIGTDHLSLNMSIEPDQDLCHMHVMKDDTGLGSLDHGRFVPLIFQFLSKGQDTLNISIPLADLGIQPRTGVSSNGAIEMDDQGNCFMGMAAAGLDAGKLPTSGCFLTTAGF